MHINLREVRTRPLSSPHFPVAPNLASPLPSQTGTGRGGAHRWGRRGARRCQENRVVAGVRGRSRHSDPLPSSVGPQWRL